jgi:hypothetical protein
MMKITEQPPSSESIAVPGDMIPSEKPNQIQQVIGESLEVFCGTLVVKTPPTGPLIKPSATKNLISTSLERSEFISRSLELFEAFASRNCGRLEEFSGMTLNSFTSKL